jgi:hypothetical protein
MTGPHVPVALDSTMRYYLHSYVCEGGYSELAAEKGIMVLRTVLIRRPERCRYAILVTPRDKTHVVVADLYELPVAADGWVALGKHWIFPDVESARAAAVISYDHL